MASIARPFGILLMFLYELVQNYGLALILFAIVIRVILLPFQMKSKRGMMRQARLQPKLAELQKKHGTNKTKINEEMAKLYKEEGVNPASGCLWGFLPLPIMLALFFAIRQPLTMMMGISPDLLNLDTGGAIASTLNRLVSVHGLESTVSNYYIQIQQAQWISDFWPSFEKYAVYGLRQLDFKFLGLNLGAQPQWNFFWTTDWSNVRIWLHGLVLFILPLLSAGSQYLATHINKKINPGSPESGGGQMKMMMTLMPLMSVYFGFIVPAALSLYWTTGTLLQILQDVVLTKHYKKILDAEDAIKNEERIKREAEIEVKRIESERKKAEGVVSQNPNVSKRKKQKSSKQNQQEKAAEWQKKNAIDPVEEKHEPSRVGNRRFARGRAYEPGRYSASGERLSESEGAWDEDEASESGIEDLSEVALGIDGASDVMADEPEEFVDENEYSDDDDDDDEDDDEDDDDDDDDDDD